MQDVEWMVLEATFHPKGLHTHKKDPMSVLFSPSVRHSTSLASGNGETFAALSLSKMGFDRSADIRRDDVLTSPSF